MSRESSVSHQQLQQKVSERLRSEILNGKFKPGEWMRQKRIAEELGVSQMPVREALKELAVEGLVEHIPYRGVRVVRFTKDDVADIYAQRACLEGRAARVVAQIISGDQIADLKALQAHMEEHLAPEDISTYRNLNRDFHQTIYRISKHSYLIRTLDQMWAIFPTMLFGNFSSTSMQPLIIRNHTDVQEHHDIISALENGDPDEAEAAVRHHIEAVCQDLTAVIKTAE